MRLKAKEREKLTKGNIKTARKEGKIPAVLYGHGERTIPIWIDKEEFKSLLARYEGSIIDLNLNGKKRVIFKEIQYDPISDDILHIDFQHVHRGEKIKTEVPIILEGVPQGVKEGGTLEQIMHHIEIECLPREMPEEFKIDITSLKINESLYLDDLDIKNAKLLEDPKEVIATIIPPKKVVKVEEVVEEEEKEEIPEEKEE